MQNEQLRQDVVDYQKQIDSQKDTILLRRGEDSDYRSQLSKKNFELVQYLDEIQVKSAHVVEYFLDRYEQWCFSQSYANFFIKSCGVREFGIQLGFVMCPSWQLGQCSCLLTSPTTLPKWDGGENQEGKKTLMGCNKNSLTGQERKK